jgi:hypothetical protein
MQRTTAVGVVEMETQGVKETTGTMADTMVGSTKGVGTEIETTVVATGIPVGTTIAIGITDATITGTVIVTGITVATITGTATGTVM